MYVIDGSKNPEVKPLNGLNETQGALLFLKETGLCSNSIYGYRFPYGSTGMIALGNGYFYFSEDHSEKGSYSSEIRLYRYTGDAEKPFMPV
jgi:hypothetical protein